MEEVKNNSGQTMGIAALVTAIITFVLAVIPCVGLIAIIPGIISIILASVGLSQAARSNSPRGLLIAGLIIGIIASMISLSQIFVGAKIAKSAGEWPSELQNIINDVQDNVIKEIEDANVSIKVESNGDTIEIKANSSGNKVNEQKLEDLEGVNSQKNDTLQKNK